MTIENLNKGLLFKRKESAKKIYMKEYYCRTNKAYCCTNYDDINDFIYLKKGTEVFTNFEF